MNKKLFHREGGATVEIHKPQSRTQNGYKARGSEERAIAGERLIQGAVGDILSSAKMKLQLLCLGLILLCTQGEGDEVVRGNFDAEKVESQSMATGTFRGGLESLKPVGF